MLESLGEIRSSSFIHHLVAVTYLFSGEPLATLIAEQLPYEITSV